jgi:phosphoribosylformylglycinamidine cyclo-ligase
MDALRVMAISKEGLWVGLNRGDNAALAAIQIMAMSGKHESRLKEHRKEMEKKIREDEVNRRHKSKKRLTYKDSGVDIDAGNLSVQLMKEHVKKTFTPDVRMDLGKFGGAISASRLKRFEDPVLVSSIDGVGTKVMVAKLMKKWDTVGKDIVNHSANDVLTTGADPMFFLDYIASEKLEPHVMEQIIKGMSEACIEAGIALIGGETAEMPGTYSKGERDIAGCIVGTVDRSRMIDGSRIQEGDMLVGLASNGLHTNGYSLARKVIFDRAGYTVKDRPPELEGDSVGEALLKPHTLYSRAVLPLLSQYDIRGIAHITGGGLMDNTPRIFPEGLSAVIEKSSIRVPPIFSLIQEKGDVPEDDLYRTFNMGIGLVLVVPQSQAGQVIQSLKNSNINSNVIGRMVKGDFGVRLE